MKNNILTSRQYGILAFLLSFVFKFSLLPGLIAEVAGRDMWLVITFAVLIEAGMLAVIVRISALGGMEAVKERYGTAVYLALALPAAMLFTVKCAVYMSEVNTFTTSYLFYNVSAEAAGVILAVAIVFLGVRAAKGIGRVAEIALWLIPILILIGAVFGKIKVEPSYVRPVAADGIGPIASAFDRSLFWFFDYTPLLFFRLKTNENVAERKRKSSGAADAEGSVKGALGSLKKYAPVIGGALGAVLIIPFLYAVFVMTYGMSGHLVGNAFSSLGSFNVVNTEIGSIDWPAIVLWLCFAVIVLSILVFAAGRTVESVGVPLPVAVTVAAAVALILAETLFFNSEKAMRFALSAARYPAAAIAVTVTAATLILLERRGKAVRSGIEAEVKDEAGV